MAELHLGRTLSVESATLGKHGHVNPSTFPPGFKPELGQLHAFGALKQVPRKRRTCYYVLEEEFPFDLERVVVDALIRHAHPTVALFDRAIDVRIPNTTRGRGERLRLAVAQARDGRAVRAI